jgi:hypothetical protein
MGDRNQIPKRAIGFRLLHELEGLLHGITADGVINDQEVQRIRRWLLENEPYTWLHPFSELSGHLETVLADGVITADETDDLLFVIGKLTTANPYFDSLRAGLQVLTGLLSGVAADAALGEDEARAMSSWADDWSHLQGLWPFDECYSIVTTMLARGQVAEYRDHLFDLARQFPVAGEMDAETGELPPVLVKGVCAVDPNIVFPQKQFVFTGDSTRAARPQLEGLVQERGGTPWPRVTKALDYLVVCDYGSKHWAFSCYGRKIEQVYKMRQQGHHAVIVHENDFWDALAGATAVV